MTQKLNFVSHTIKQSIKVVNISPPVQHLAVHSQISETMTADVRDSTILSYHYNEKPVSDAFPYTVKISETLT